MKPRARKPVMLAGACASALALCPTLAFASEGEETGGISAILPDMLEFVPMLVAFIILWIILAKFGWPMFAGMLEKRENTIREAIRGRQDRKRAGACGVQEAAGRRKG